MPIKKMIKNIKEKKEVKKKAKVEAEKIFIKNNQTGPLAKYQGRATGVFPKVDEDSPKPYRNEAKRVEKQVVKYRLKQYKAKKK